MSEQQDNNGNRRWKSFTARLKASTLLSNRRAEPILPLSSMKKIRDALIPNALEPPDLKRLNPYHYAKRKMNMLWNGGVDKEASYDTSPVSSFTTMRGVMASYWTGEMLRESLRPTLGLGGLITLSSVNLTMMLDAYASTLSALLNDGDMLTGAARFTAHGIGAVWMDKRMFALSNELKRNMAFYIKDRFQKAILEEPRIVDEINVEENEDDQVTPHHAIGRAPDELADGLIDIGRRGYASFATAVALTYAIATNSQAVPYIGENGTLWLALGVTGIYSGVTYKYGAILGEKVEDTMEAMQKAESRLTEKIVKAFDKGNGYSRDIFQNDFAKDNNEIREKREKYQQADQRYMHFMQKSWLGQFVTSPLPALSSIPWGESGALSAITQQSFLATHAQTQFLMQTVSQAVDLFASRGRITVPAKLLADMATQFDQVREDVRTEEESETITDTASVRIPNCAPEI
ncbi:MAG: hypothetical protein AAGB32_01505 [Pseudomonadota bacterium]